MISKSVLGWAKKPPAPTPDTSVSATNSLEKSGKCSTGAEDGVGFIRFIASCCSLLQAFFERLLRTKSLPVSRTNGSVISA